MWALSTMPCVDGENQDKRQVSGLQRKHPCVTTSSDSHLQHQSLQRDAYAHLSKIADGKELNVS